MKALLLLPVLSFLAAPDGAVTLKFKYAPGDEERTRMKLQMKLDMAVSSPSVKTEQKMGGPMDFTLLLKTKKAGEGEFLFDAGFEDVSMEQEVVAEERKVSVKVRGKQVRIEADGMVVVDTENGVNPEAAQAVLDELKPFAERSDLMMDARGLMKGEIKNAKLRELFAGAGGDNLYPVVLPDKPVEVGDTWTYVNKLSKLGEITLSKPVEVPIRFKLLKLEGTGADQVAVILLESEQALKDLDSDAQLKGVGPTKVKIAELKVLTKVTTRFSVARGRLVSSSLEATVAGKMEMTPENLAETLSLKLNLTLTGEVVPK